MDDAQKAAKQWLIKNDPDAADFWSEQPDDSDFVQAKRENIATFGPDEGDDA